MGKTTRICPDCGEKLDTIDREVSHYERYSVDHETMELHLTSMDEGKGDCAWRCPHCDTLNVDQPFGAYKIGDPEYIR